MFDWLKRRVKGREVAAVESSRRDLANQGVRRVGADRAVLVLEPGVEMEFARVPAGAFMMGSNDGDDVEKPRHIVTLPEYWIGRAPVTVAQFATFSAATGYKTVAERDRKSYTLDGSTWTEVIGADWKHPNGPATDTKGKMDHPVVQVSWDDVIAFSAWMARATGKAIRLPNEAEWEKAARGTDGRKYPWGNAAPTEAHSNFNNNVGTTTSVGKYSPLGDSPYGCVDMAGNVWQWVNSLFRRYPYSATDGRESATDRGPRVFRGGGFNTNLSIVQATGRGYIVPAFRLERYGFRVCASSI